MPLNRYNEKDTYALVDKDDNIIVFSGKKMLFRTKASAIEKKKKITQVLLYDILVKQVKKPGIRSPTYNRFNDISKDT